MNIIEHLQCSPATNIKNISFAIFCAIFSVSKVNAQKFSKGKYQIDTIVLKSTTCSSKIEKTMAFLTGKDTSIIGVTFNYPIEERKALLLDELTRKHYSRTTTVFSTYFFIEKRKEKGTIKFFEIHFNSIKTAQEAEKYLYSRGGVGKSIVPLYYSAYRKGNAVLFFYYRTNTEEDRQEIRTTLDSLKEFDY